MKTLLLVPFAALMIASPAAARTAALKWMDGPPGLPSGAKFAVVSGDPGKAQKFTIRLKVPANYSVAAHNHPTDEHVRILSGRVGYGMSDKLDRAHAKSLGAGGNVTMKAKANHWVFTRGTPAELQISAMGPFAITYVDPKDDPRK
jgi:hypothetical protein